MTLKAVLLRFAKRKGDLSEIPEFTIKSGRINARPDLPEAEWRLLLNFLPGYVDRAQDKRRQRERFYLKFYGKKRMRDPKMATEVTKDR